MPRHFAYPKLVVATHNRGKAGEIATMLSPFGVKIVSAGDLGLPAPDETGTTFEANATIKAPIRGTVLTRDVEIGSPVSSILNLGANASLVMTLGDIQKVFVRGKVDEADVGRVKLGQAARISVETFKDRSFEGKVTQISPIGVERDNVTTFEVKVSIDNPGNALKANIARV